MEIQVERPLLHDQSQYGDSHGCGLVAPVLQTRDQEPMPQLTPSAPPEDMSNQAFRVVLPPGDQEFQTDANLESLSGTGAQTGMQSFVEVEYRARHINAGSAGDMSLVMHHDRWSKVDQQNKKKT